MYRTATENGGRTKDGDVLADARSASQWELPEGRLALPLFAGVALLEAAGIDDPEGVLSSTMAA
ncbi:hypothetical protein ACFY2M_42710 [Streptomyces sp. NPDC001276]|uniref:hypothetical protein n=1 Tax=Streptomyces sp. NPDC001276 TaxID=3364555 RepID=UPI0036AA48BB